MKQKFLWIVLISLFFSLTLTGYGAEEEKDFSLRFALQFPTLTFSVEQPKATLYDLTFGETGGTEYWPNSPVILNLGVSYKEFGVSYSFLLAHLNDDQIRSDVNTRYQDIQAFYYGEVFQADFYFQNYQGFYLEEPQKHIPTWTSDMKYPSRNDLSVLFVGTNLYYTLWPENFSLGAAFQQTRTQKKSGGSFIFVLSPSYYEVSADASLTFSAEDALYGADAGFKEGRFITLGAGAGAGYTLILGENSDSYVYLSGFYLFGTGIQYQHFTTDSGKKSGFKPGYSNYIRMALGKNEPGYFYGLSLIAYGNAAFLEESSLLFLSMMIEINMGFRF